jgi:hypothetical protein
MHVQLAGEATRKVTSWFVLCRERAGERAAHASNAAHVHALPNGCVYMSLGMQLHMQLQCAAAWAKD